MPRTLSVNAAMLLSTSDDATNANGSYVVGYLTNGHFWPFPGADVKSLAATPTTQRRAVFQASPTVSVPLTSIPVPAGATNVAQVRAASVPVLARQIVTQEHDAQGNTIDHVLMADGTVIL